MSGFYANPSALAKTTDLNAATADDTGVATVVQSIGNKADTAPATSTPANATLSVLSYLKALWNLLRTAPWATPATVWANGSRSLSAFGCGTAIHQTQTSLAALTILDLRPAAGAFRIVTVSAVNPGNGGAYAGMGLLQAGSTRQYCYVANATTSPAGTAGGVLTGDSTVGPMIYNGDPANPINYQYAGMDITL